MNSSTKIMGRNESVQSLLTVGSSELNTNFFMKRDGSLGKEALRKDLSSLLVN